MTRKDKFRGKPEVKDRICMLGITEDRFLFMRNYCPEIDDYQPKRYHVSVFPYMEVPVFHFLKQVVCPHQQIIYSTAGFGSTTWSINFNFFRIEFSHSQYIMCRLRRYQGKTLTYITTKRIR